MLYGTLVCPPILYSCPTPKPHYSLSDVDKPCRPCSIRCQGVSGLIPTLQCRICLCLYHNECVGLPPHSAVQGYVCKVRTNLNIFYYLRTSFYYKNYSQLYFKVAKSNLNLFSIELSAGSRSEHYYSCTSTLNSYKCP